ncbi:hypothetical protein [Dyella sp.]|jgi:hypothetical protein|uniref:hypothetical protein n=1 Tax=Dyella sp. TaxID=1869338 RepID=UPI002D790E54|nr:hypothetical protein [Dyella sp.]HET6432424.1 hypothetical protein [Dyella sp.]
MDPHPVQLFVPYADDMPWIVRHDVGRVGTFGSRAEAVRAAMAMRSKLGRAWGLSHPPVQVQECDGSWHDADDVPPIG